MATSVFSARFIPTNSAAVTGTTFDVAATVSDGTGQYSGFDVAVGNLVFLDAAGSLSNPNTISRYRITVVNSQTGSTVNVRLVWADSGPVVDPAEILGSQGFICAASATNVFAWHAAPTLQNFPDYVVQYARNYELWNIIDGQLGGGGGSGEGTLLTADVTLSSAQILALNATPVQLLPAPGAGKFTVIDSVEMKLVFNSIAYTGSGADLYIDFQTTPAENMSIDGNILLANATTTRFGQPVFVLPDTVALGINEAIFISTPSAFSSGNSTLKIRLRYRTYIAIT